MNKRIKELATKWANQRSEFNGHMIYTFADNSLEKFAELIVRECLGVVEKCHEQAMNDEWDTDYAMCSARVDIETHFGVE